MRFDLKRPCKDCPFRKDVTPYLRPDRAAEILDAIERQDQSFTCHKTISGEQQSDEGYVPGETDQFCAGALIMLEKMGSPNRLPRIAEFLKIYDPTQLRGHDNVFDSRTDMIDAMSR